MRRTSTFFICFALIFLHVQCRNEDLIKNFFLSKDSADLPIEAKEFLVLWRNQQRSTTDGHWCCAITPPSIPIFSATGDLLHYQPQPCPDTHMVCCKGYINIQGQCFSFDEIKDILPAWQSLFAAFGSSLTPEQILNVVHQIG